MRHMEPTADRNFNVAADVCHRLENPVKKLTEGTVEP